MTSSIFSTAARNRAKSICRWFFSVTSVKTVSVCPSLAMLICAE